MPSTSVLHFIQISPTISLISPSKPPKPSHQFSYRDPHLLPTTLSFLSHTSSKHRPPRFYSLPKIHKLADTIKVPPLRPIVSHTNSILSRSAQFLDHVLQPLARIYPDYFDNPTDLINILSTFHVSRDVTLVSMDMVKLYPSIPQEECNNTVAREIQAHQHLLIIDPNFIIQLLAYNMRNNFFRICQPNISSNHRHCHG